MWVDVDDLRSDIQTQITKIEGRGRTLNAAEVGKIIGLQMVQTILDEYEEPQKPEVDWDNVPVDTLVRVRDNDNEEWVLQYFKGIDKNRETLKYMAWSYGATSVTAQGNSTHWQYCELVEVEDNGK